MRRLYPMIFVMSVLVLAGSLSAEQLDNSIQSAELAQSGLPASSGDTKTGPIDIIAVDDILKISSGNETEAITASVLDITVSASAMLASSGYDFAGDVIEVAGDLFDLGSAGSEYIFEGLEASDFQVDPDAIAAITFTDSVTGIDVSDIELLDVFGPAY